MAYGSYTDYLEMLAAQPQDKLALVDDAASFTYGQLVAEAKKLRTHAYETGMNEETFRDMLDELMVRITEERIANN